MHYVGMLAVRTMVPVQYHLPTVVVSLCSAVLASAIALYMVSRPTLSRVRLVGGGIFMGCAIASMHYIGMAAMRMPCGFIYSPALVALSLVLAVVISMVALYLCFASKHQVSSWTVRKFGSAFLMGIAVPTVHYVGMAAVRMQPMSAVTPMQANPLAVQVSELGVAGVIGVVVFITFAALLLARFNRDTLAIQYRLESARQQHETLNHYQQRLIRAYRQNGVGAWEWDPHTDSFSVDPGIRTIYDSPLAELEPVPRSQLLDQVHPDDLATLQSRWSAALAHGETYENEYRIHHRDGGTRRCRSVATITRNADGSVQSVAGMSWDVTAEHQQQQEQVEQARRFYLTLEAIGDAIISTDPAGLITYANPVACQLTGWSSDECFGQPFTDVFVAQDQHTGVIRRSAIARCIAQGGKLLSEDGVLLSRTGARYNIQKHVSLVDDQGSAVVTFQDITAACRLKRDLEIAATHDKLTGLPNRAAFETALENAWTNKRDGHRSHCLALIDIDRFKLVNDTAGHLAGDALLQRVVTTLQPLIRPTDLLARMGGDEFLLLLHDTDTDRAQSFCHTLLGAVEDIHFVWQQRTYSVTASLGMVFFDRHSDSLDALTSQADVALFTSKRNGRNRLALYEAAIGEAAGNLQEMEAVAEIRSALQEDRFELHAQPIVALNRSGAPPYFELLVRMRDADGSLVPPSRFIPAAECYGMMMSIDRWVIQNALGSYADSPHVGRGLRFAINLSADSLSDPTLWNFVYEQFQRTGVATECVTFEVTESGLIRNMSAALNFMALARAAGCRIALDDFGTRHVLTQLSQAVPAGRDQD